MLNSRALTCRGALLLSGRESRLLTCGSELRDLGPV